MISAEAKSSNIQVNLSWTYKNFPEQIQVYEVMPLKANFISETAVVDNLKMAPLLNNAATSFQMKSGQSRAMVLVVDNKEDKDLYFFAVPHEMHPPSASAGHFFECLCIGRVFKVPAKKVWYRIVRVNLNSSFQDISQFTIQHQVIGLTEEEVKKSYQDRLYNQ